MINTSNLLAYLLTSTAIEQLYFQYGEAADGAISISTQAIDTSERRRYVDGSEPKQLDFVFTWYKPLSTLPVSTTLAQGETNQNVAELDDVSAIIDWIEEQNHLRNFPDLGEHCVVDEIYCLTNHPRMAGVDIAANPPLARYTFTIRINYIDYTYAI